MRKSPMIVYVLAFLMSINFTTPVFAVFCQEQGMESNQIIRLFAIFSLTVFLLEVPTGALCDRIGEKKSLIIGSVLTVLSTLCFIYGNVMLLYIGEVMLGVGGTFYSGPFDSLIYKFCNANDKNYDKIASKAYSMQWLALCCSFLGCFFLIQYGSLRIVFVATLVANVFLLVITFLLPSFASNNEYNNIFDSMKHLVGELKTNGFLLYICLWNIFFSMILVSGYQILQTYLLDSSLPETYNGILYFVAVIFASLGSYVYNWLNKLFKAKKITLILCLSLISCCFFGLSIVSGIILIFIFVCMYRLIWGVTSPMFSSMVNQNLGKDDYRNTAFSLISLGSNLGSSLLLFVFSKVNLSIKQEYLILGLLSLIFVVFSIFFSQQLRKTSDNI